MKSLKQYNDKDLETGRAIAQGMRIENMQREKNMARFEKRTGTILERQAEAALKGTSSRINNDGSERSLLPKN